MFDQLDPNSSLCSSFVFLGGESGLQTQKADPSMKLASVSLVGEQKPEQEAEN